MYNEKHKRYMREWRKKNKKAYRKYRFKYLEDNKEKLKEQAKKYYVKHRKELIRQATERQNNHPLKSLRLKVVSANKRYPDRIKLADVLFVVDKYKNTCHWCGKKDLQGRDLTLEHLKPINKREFLTLACLKCNGSKRHKNNGKLRTEEEKKAMQKIRSQRWHKKHGKEYRIKWQAERGEEYNRIRRERYISVRKCKI